MTFTPYLLFLLFLISSTQATRAPWEGFKPHLSLSDASDTRSTSTDTPLPSKVEELDHLASAALGQGEAGVSEWVQQHGDSIFDYLIVELCTRFQHGGDGAGAAAGQPDAVRFRIPDNVRARVAESLKHMMPSNVPDPDAYVEVLLYRLCLERNIVVPPLEDLAGIAKLPESIVQQTLATAAPLGRQSRSVSMVKWVASMLSAEGVAQVSGVAGDMDDVGGKTWAQMTLEAMLNPNPEYVTQLDIPVTRRRYSEILEGGGRQEHRVLLDWLFEYGMVDFGTVRLSNMGDEGWGLTAAVDVAKGDNLFAIPASCMLYLRSPFVHPFTRTLLDLVRDWREGGHVDVGLNSTYGLLEMGMYFVLEQHLPDSHWRPYFDTLMDPYCPFLYEDDELAELQNDWFARLRKVFCGHVIAMYDDFIVRSEEAADILHRHVHSDPAELKRRFILATITVLQRSFDWTSDGRVLIPFMGYFNHDRLTDNAYYFTTITDPLVSATTKAASTYLAESGEASADGEAVPPPKTMKAQGTSRPVILVAATRDYKAGDQLHINYNRNLNSPSLYLQYGFVVPGYLNDFIQLQLAYKDSDEELNALRKARIAALNLPWHIAVGRDGIIDYGFVQALMVAMMDRKEIDLLTLKMIEMGVAVEKEGGEAEEEVDPEKQQLLTAREEPRADVLDAVDMLREPMRIATAYRRIYGVAHWALKRFPTTIEEDDALLKGGTLSTNKHMAVTFRSEAKKLVRKMSEELLVDAALAVQDGSQPRTPDVPVLDASDESLLLWPFFALQVANLKPADSDSLEL